MTRTVWKFLFNITNAPIVPMPAGARILPHVHADSPIRLVVWAEVDPAAPVEPRHLRVVGTGHPLADVGPYIGTATAGGFVWHVYDSVDEGAEP